MYFFYRRENRSKKERVKFTSKSKIYLFFLSLRASKHIFLWIQTLFINEKAHRSYHLP